LTHQETRLKKIKEAKAALEAEAKLAQEEDEKKTDDDNNNDPPTTPPQGRVKYKKKTGEPVDKAQRNLLIPSQGS